MRVVPERKDGFQLKPMPRLVILVRLDEITGIAKDWPPGMTPWKEGVLNQMLPNRSNHGEGKNSPINFGRVPVNSSILTLDNLIRRVY